MKEQRTEIPAGNRRLAKKRVKCLNEGLYFASSSVLTESSVLRNPLLRQAQNVISNFRQTVQQMINQ
jgi:hypothetical protein